MIGMKHERFTAADGSLVALVDCDSFYASCERVARPDLVGRPIVVLSNNDGCIVARSREAKKLGIPMGEPEYQVRPLLEKHGVAVFSSNYALYGDLSRRVMQTVKSVAPDIEIYSIDECFAHLRGALARNVDEVVREIRARVLKWTGLPISVGIGPTRTLAKIATRVAKNWPAYGGIFDLSKSDRIDSILEWVRVGDIWGIGRRGALKLRTEGIFNARELRDADPGKIRKLLTVTGHNTQMELLGIPAVGPDIPASHNLIISSRSLGIKATTIGPLLEAAAWHAQRAAEKLRAKKHVASLVGVRIQTAWYRDDLPTSDEMTMIGLSWPTDDSAIIVEAAGRGMRRIFRPGHAYAKVMVLLSGLSHAQKRQEDIFGLAAGEKEKRERRARLMALMDRINRIEGAGSLVLASQGPKNLAWKMKRERLSPRWTTNWRELLKARC